MRWNFISYRNKPLGVHKVEMLRWLDYLHKIYNWEASPQIIESNEKHLSKNENEKHSKTLTSQILRHKILKSYKMKTKITKISFHSNTTKFPFVKIDTIIKWKFWKKVLTMMGKWWRDQFFCSTVNGMTVLSVHSKVHDHSYPKSNQNKIWRVVVFTFLLPVSF